MLKIGITGGIGGGKTTVCNFFRILGIPVFSADIEAKYLINNDINLKLQLIEAFGKEIYHENGEINKAVFSKIIFSDKKELEKSNSIIHPAVNEHYKKWCNKYKELKYTLKEAAILFESGTYKNVDFIITVTAPIEQRIERALKRDKISRELIEKKIKNQLSDEYKIKNSDFVVYNDDNRLIIPQILEIDNELKRKS